jgi:hypothetical protein
MSYTYSFERVTPETDGYGDTIFDTPENNTEPTTDLFSDLSDWADWTDEDLAEYEAYYEEHYDETEELQQEARNNRE